MTRKAAVYFQDRLAGLLRETDSGYAFQYDPDFLKTDTARAISLTMPLSKNPYRSNVLFPFFDGLIPEGWLLEIGEKHWKLNPRDRFELLINLCRDAIGAVSIYPMEAEGDV